MTKAIREPLDLIFVWWPDNDYGAILTRGYHTLAEQFHIARHTTGTWGEFLAALGDSADYLEPFMEHDETEPRDNDRLDDLSGVWVLENDEFPVTQCAEETFTFYGHSFPELDGAVMIRTEYGMSIRLYPKSAYLELKTHLVEKGHRVSEEIARYPMCIFHY
jgi:hypothetical protein